MRLELFVLMAVVGLAIAVGQVEPQVSSADPSGPLYQTDDRVETSPDQACQSLQSFLAELEQVCPLRRDQRQQLAGRLDGVCRELQATHDRLWQCVEQMRNAPAGSAADARMEDLQLRCGQLRSRRDRIVWEVLDADQRGRWRLAILLPRIQDELEGVALTPSQWEELRRIGGRILQEAGPIAGDEENQVLCIVRQVYLEVLDSRQRREYAHFVQLRQRRRMNLARTGRED